MRKRRIIQENDRIVKHVADRYIPFVKVIAVRLETVQQQELVA